MRHVLGSERTPYPSKAHLHPQGAAFIVPYDLPHSAGEVIEDMLPVECAIVRTNDAILRRSEDVASPRERAPSRTPVAVEEGRSVTLWYSPLFKMATDILWVALVRNNPNHVCHFEPNRLVINEDAGSVEHEEGHLAADERSASAACQEHAVAAGCFWDMTAETIRISRGKLSI